MFGSSRCQSNRLEPSVFLWRRTGEYHSNVSLLPSYIWQICVCFSTPALLRRSDIPRLIGCIAQHSQVLSFFSVVSCYISGSRPNIISRLSAVNPSLRQWTTSVVFMSLFYENGEYLNGHLYKPICQYLLDTCECVLDTWVLEMSVREPFITS